MASLTPVQIKFARSTTPESQTSTVPGTPQSFDRMPSFLSDSDAEMPEAKVLLMSSVASSEQSPEESDLMEHLADNSLLGASTIGPADDSNKGVQKHNRSTAEPTWGMTVAGVLMGSRAFRCWSGLARALCAPPAGSPDGPSDSPALTQDGRAVYLDGGRPVFFPYNHLELASGNAAKCTARQAIRQIRAARMERTAREAEERLAPAKACALDQDGVVHAVATLGGVPVLGPVAEAPLRRLLRWRRARARRNRRAENAEQPVFCVDSAGRVSTLRDLATGEARAQRRAERVHSARARDLQPEGSSAIATLSADGVVRGWQAAPQPLVVRPPAPQQPRPRGRSARPSRGYVLP